MPLPLLIIICSALVGIFIVYPLAYEYYYEWKEKRKK